MTAVETTVPAVVVMRLVDRELAGRCLTRRHLTFMVADRTGRSPEGVRQAVIRAERVGTMPLRLADEVLVTMGLHLSDVEAVAS